MPRLATPAVPPPMTTVPQPNTLHHGLMQTAPIDLTRPRVQGEELLRNSYGAILFNQSAGNHGPGRNPVEWIRTGRVNRSRKYVNLIHVEDLACAASRRLYMPSQAVFTTSVMEIRGPGWRSAR